MTSIAFLTCGRSDFSIYLPLIKELKNLDVSISILAFGSHLSSKYGNSLQEIINIKPDHLIKINSLNKQFSQEDIALSMADTLKKFANIWNKYQFDMVFALGDRFEMFAAVASGIPFNVRFAHLHGGEQTLGAIDDVFRHSISAMSKIHFASTKQHADRVKEILGKKENVHNVGSLSLHNINKGFLYTKKEFYKKFNIPNQPFVLVTIHPETIDLNNNEPLVNQSVEVLDEFEIMKVVTLPNNDTSADVVRNKLLMKKKSKDYIIFDSMGVKGYYSAIKFCKFMFGNSSSGIIESMYFKKNVMNLGNRQKGRQQNENVFNVPIDKTQIRKTFKELIGKSACSGNDLFFKKNGPKIVIKEVLKYLT